MVDVVSEPTAAELLKAAEFLKKEVMWRRQYESEHAAQTVCHLIAVTDGLERVVRWLEAQALRVV